MTIYKSLDFLGCPAYRVGSDGRVCRFVLSRTETRDGDLLAWHFAPVEFAGWVEGVTIFND